MDGSREPVSRWAQTYHLAAITSAKTTSLGVSQALPLTAADGTTGWSITDARKPGQTEQAKPPFRRQRHLLLPATTAETLALQECDRGAG